MRERRRGGKRKSGKSEGGDVRERKREGYTKSGKILIKNYKGKVEGGIY